ncbi:MAG TPA: ABC transporter substrate-binding protein [Candidatus Binataceae bacterium]|nr:ABC transporter substrate-binding protein [Candidatus Binataceae bacterium]
MRRDEVVIGSRVISGAPRRAWMAAAAIAMAAAGLALSGWFSAALADGDPMSVTQQTVNQALSVLRNRQLVLADRQQQLRRIVEATFDYTEMSRSALGYHWKEISPDQQQEFSSVFTTFIEDSYLAKINSYSNQQVEFLRATSDDADYAQVSTNIVDKDQQPISVNYRLLNTGGAWKIYDVDVDGISIIANYRNQFNRVMNNQGYATLIKDLKSKQAALAASLVAH